MGEVLLIYYNFKKKKYKEKFKDYSQSRNKKSNIDQLKDQS